MKTGGEESVARSVKNAAKRRDEPRMGKPDRPKSLKDLISLTSLMSQAFMAKDVSTTALSFTLTATNRSWTVFHHDGPFDACNPHRNRKKDVRAPMQAFPVDSANNVLGGSGPLNKNIDLDRFHGRGEDAFNDYSQSRTQVPAKHVQSFNPTDRVEQIHTSESVGLGTSTFLEGAPASRKDLQRRESETETSAFPGGGLTRKKSLAVRLRGLSQNRNAVTSPDANYGPMSPNSPGQVQSAGGRNRIAGNSKESNPFFSDYNDAYEKKGATIRYAEETKGSRTRAPSSPHRNGLTRSVTADSVPTPSNEMPEKSSGGGFLNRMKSLKGGRRARPERRET